MKTFRIVVGLLAGVVIVLLLVALWLPPVMYDQDTLLEMAYLLVGLPLLTLNYWAWFEPEIIEVSFFGSGKVR